MAQVSWIFLDDFGGRHRVGLYHGDRSGHLLIYCDARIVQVDFSVKESRTYSFFIEDELCEVSIQREKAGFSYGFRVNKQVDTPRNRQRRAAERRNWWGVAAMSGGLIVVIWAAVSLLMHWDTQQKQRRWADAFTFPLSAQEKRRLNREGHVSLAHFFITYENQQRLVCYSFATQDNRLMIGRFWVPDTGLILLPTGFPIHDRDAFKVQYLPDDPSVHRVLFEEPAPETIAAYLDLAARVQHAAYPNHRFARSRCIAQVALEEKGWPVLANFIFQTASAAQNPRHNRESYLRLVREPALARRMERECWDK
ncbi:MAG: hypothetical protein NZM43_08730 [Saprospiraceae bacterium]|nr:hypothetical protein [Saprospiraceae bacterium]MDW8484396.1 hypothetical protein [Saprospiraceae bacterium]